MILEFNYEKKTVTIKGAVKLSELTGAMNGKEDWDVVQERKIVKEYIYQPYYPDYPKSTWTYETYGAPGTVTMYAGDSVTLTNFSSN